MIRFFTVLSFGTALLFAPTAKAQTWDDRPFDASVPAGQDGDIIAFVGRKVAFDENTLPFFEMIKLPDGREVERKIPALSNRYEARYKVMQGFSDDSSPSFVDFELYDHYGNPHLPKIDHPLAFLTKHKDKWVSMRGRIYSLSQTRDGDWAICSTPYPTKKSSIPADRYLHPVMFTNPVDDKNGQPCRFGTLAEDIVRYHNEAR